jgi:hypothetical protein
LKKKFGPIYNYRTFPPKYCHWALKNIGLGSGIRKKPIPDPGFRGKEAPDPGSESATLPFTVYFRKKELRYG